MMGDQNCRTKYEAGRQKCKEKGFSESVPSDGEEDPSKITWYLPYHGVENINKPKVRIVFDCAAKYRKVSLNDALYQGPDLMNNLLGVLL